MGSNPTTGTIIFFRKGGYLLASVSISKGNSKLGNIPSVSLPAGVTCRQCDCHTKCYAKKIERLRPVVAKAYKKNLDILLDDPDKYWREVESSIMVSAYFRFHVSGDIPNKEYFERMIEVAKRNTHCQILCFTKKFYIVNSYLRSGEKIPENLHIVFSGWKNLIMDNPFSLPEAHVKFRDGTTTANDHAMLCNGNCTECAMTRGGCWTLKNGEQVVFNEH